MNNREQDNYNNATLDLIKKFVDSNQRKRINSLTQIESEVENIFNLGPVSYTHLTLPTIYSV